MSNNTYMSLGLHVLYGTVADALETDGVFRTDCADHGVPIDIGHKPGRGCARSSSGFSASSHKLV